MFTDNRGDTTLNNNNTVGPTILRREVELARKLLKSNKSLGPDKIYPEILKLISEEYIDQLDTLYQQIYDTGQSQRCG